MVNEVHFSFNVAGFNSPLKVESFRVSETISTPFEINLTVLSEDSTITFEALSRKLGTLTLIGQGTADARLFNGAISELRYLGTGRRFSRYQITLVPQLWFLTQRQDCRIFRKRL